MNSPLVRRLFYTLGGALIVLVLFTVFRSAVTLALQRFFGFRNNDGNSPQYLFWSGAGSDLAYLSFVAGAFIYYRKENCKTRWCPWLGLHEFKDPETGVVRKLCWYHHPDVAHKHLTTERIREIQKKRHLYVGKTPGKG